MKKFKENVTNDDNSIFELLHIADQFNLDILKVNY